MGSVYIWIKVETLYCKRYKTWNRFYDDLEKFNNHSMNELEKFEGVFTERTIKIFKGMFVCGKFLSEKKDMIFKDFKEFVFDCGDNLVVSNWKTHPYYIELKKKADEADSRVALRPFSFFKTVNSNRSKAIICFVAIWKYRTSILSTLPLEIIERIAKFAHGGMNKILDWISPKDIRFILNETEDNMSKRFL